MDKGFLKKQEILFVFVFLIALALRVNLALVNQEANDPHFEVIKIIKDQGKIPRVSDCWECFHPKLYYLVTAFVLKVIPVKAVSDQIRVAQLINCAAGILTLWIIFLFLKQKVPDIKLRFLSFSLIALNPKFIGVNAQASNDSFVILFASLVIYLTYRLLLTSDKKYFWGITLFTVLAGVTKANGLVLFFAAAGTFILNVFLYPAGPLKRRYLRYLALFILIFSLTVPYFGQYIEKYKNYGTPFQINVPHEPLPHLFKKTYVKRPGVTSIADSYFTFRLGNLIKYPFTSNYRKFFPLHRTSLWTNLYGRANSTHFDMWPQSWSIRSRKVLNLGRAIFIFALVPALIFLIGLIKGIKNAAGIFIKRERSPNLLSEGLVFDIFLWGYLFFIIALTLVLRDSSAMKVIYIYPALLPFVVMFIRGYRIFEKIGAKYPVFIFVVDLFFPILCVLYSADVLSLIMQLSH